MDVCIPSIPKTNKQTKQTNKNEKKRTKNKFKDELDLMKFKNMEYQLLISCLDLWWQISVFKHVYNSLKPCWATNWYGCLYSFNPWSFNPLIQFLIGLANWPTFPEIPQSIHSNKHPSPNKNPPSNVQQVKVQNGKGSTLLHTREQEVMSNWSTPDDTFVMDKKWSLQKQQ